jgi:hypothetical protein
MSRVRLGLFLSAVGLTAGLGGCQSSGGSGNMFANWPWMHQAAQKEEYKVPPMEDSRYTESQTFPKETMQATLRSSEGQDVSKPGGAPGRGLVGPMRQTAAGGGRY